MQYMYSRKNCKEFKGYNDLADKKHELLDNRHLYGCRCSYK